ncbi:MAG: FlgD immunoglobulin-like domain containing protein [Bacteroidota bacterium]
MRLSAKRPTVFLLILFAPFVATAQTTWQEYYPLHVGDFWEYQLYEDNIPIKNSVKVIGDTLMPNGLTYKIVRDTEHDGPYPGSHISFTRVDTAGQVWSYSPFACSDRLLYRLGARVGDTLRNPCFADSLTYWKLIERLPAIVFGDTTEIQTWDWVNSPLLGVETLARGFGLIVERGEGVERYLRGAIINGRKYGDITVSVKTPSVGPSIGFVLHPNYPNPFNSETVIHYSLGKRMSVSIVVYDVLGRKIRNLFLGYQELGAHSVTWDGRADSGSAVESGIYFLRFSALQASLSIKMALVK